MARTKEGVAKINYVDFPNTDLLNLFWRRRGR